MIRQNRSWLVIVILSIALTYLPASVCHSAYTQDEIPNTNGIGYRQRGAFVSDQDAYWSFSHLTYSHFSARGTYIARANYSRRFGTGGTQYQVVAYPQFKYGYAALSAAYSSLSQIVFPNYFYRAEGFVDLSNLSNISKGLLVSAGYRSYILIRLDNNFYAYTGSIRKYFGNYLIVFRPNYYVPSGLYFYELSLRRFFNHTKNYIRLLANTGRIPDIAGLPPLNERINIKQKSIGIDAEFEIYKNLFANGGFSFTQQVLPSSTIRRIASVSLGLQYRF